MKQSTTQDQAYLKECLAYHERRYAYFDAFEVHAEPVREKLTYHAKQVKWFKSKLQSHPKVTYTEALASVLDAKIPTTPQYKILPTISRAEAEAFFNDSYLDRTKDPLTYTKPTPVKDFFRRALNRIRGI